MKLPDFSKAHILAIGDAMIDVWVDGVVERISPEAPVPIFKKTSHRSCPGGMANMAANLSALGVTVRKLNDPEAEQRLVKTRYHSNGHQILRVDFEEPPPMNGVAEQQMIEAIGAWAKEADLIAISDYGKGCITRKIMAAALMHGKAVVVDPTGADWTLYQGVTVIKPNRKELFELLSRRPDLAVDEAIFSLSGTIASSVVATLGEEGMKVLDSRSSAAQVRRIPAHKAQVFDLAGAGDTAMAALCASLAIGKTLFEAATIANAAAGVAVTKRGTAIVTRDELAKALEDL